MSCAACWRRICLTNATSGAYWLAMIGAALGPVAALCWAIDACFDTLTYSAEHEFFAPDDADQDCAWCLACEACAERIERGPQ